jgi:hypothetical protein
MEAYLAMLMEGNPANDDLMDDEYYLFADEGTPPITQLYPACLSWLSMI